MMKEIADTFAKHFSHWQITLPEKNLKKRCSGFIHDAGWLIQYCFGEDENGEYLDYYATHRMTDDSHVRIYEDGEIEDLPTLEGLLLLSDDPEEANKIREDHDRHNREVVAILVNKGFDKFTINMYLNARLDKE